MAQHDYVLADQSGLSFLSDLNNALAAVVTNNSGATAPSPTYPYMLWADTTAGQLKIRNAANNGWGVVGTLGSATLGLLSREGGTMTGALLAAGGTVSLPGLAFSGDPDTGIFRPGANFFAIATAGVERVDFGPNNVVFNDGGADYDFRVEGVTNPNLFVIDAGTDEVRVANLGGGPLGGLRNLLINGNPTINQRGYVSGTATTTANQYTLDRWRVVTSGQSVSWTDTDNVRTVTAPAGGLVQVVEGANVIGGTYTLSWVGTATATINGTAITNGGNRTLAGGANVTVRFSGGTFSRAQLEVGNVATPFERRHIGMELRLCQRFFQWFGAGVSGQEETPTTFSIGGVFQQDMRVAPTATFIGSTFSTRITGEDRSIAGVSINASSISNQAAWFLLNCSGGNVAGRYIQNRDASSVIQLSAEL